MPGDIDLFVRTIEEVGVDPYINLSKDEFYREIQTLINRINRPLTRREVLSLFAPVVNDLKLSHTHLLIPLKRFEEKMRYDKNNGKYLPLELRIDDNRLLLDENYSQTKFPVGEEILAINDLPAKDIIGRLYSYADGATRYSKLMDLQNSLSIKL